MKRLFDFIVALILLLLLSPIMMITAVLVFFKLGSPILFTQSRPGLNGKVFQMIKFRTMLNSKNAHGDLLSDAQRITKFGAFLRSTSLDELPALINVIRGEMSLVGPRPLLIEYLPLYNREQARRHGVRPGITGWAQINGRNAISWEEKFALDVWYVDHHTFRVDVKILWLTIVRVLKRENINADAEMPMPRFTGTQG